MGLLDDAIREHLELKRKHGADPEDVARQEQEALGPGQRNEFAQPEGAAPAPEPRRSRRPRPAAPRSRAARSPRRSTSCPRASPASPRSRPPPRRRATTRTRGWTRSATRSPPTRRSSRRAAQPRRRRGGGRAGGDAGLPPGDARARPPVVRAEAAARLRLGQVARSSSGLAARPMTAGASSPE